jgi:hypothetical protein
MKDVGWKPSRMFCPLTCEATKPRKWYCLFLSVSDRRFAAALLFEDLLMILEHEQGGVI